MRNLIEFIVRNRNFLTFFFLELVCFTLVVQFNREQRQILLNSTSTYAGAVFDLYSQGLDYLDLKKENQVLEEKNQVLEEYLYALLGKEVEMDAIRLDTMEYNFEFIPGKIIKNSITGLDNMITINKGRNDGVEEHMGVVGLNGLVGVVVDVSAHYSVAMSLLHRQTRISARLRSTPYFGSLAWRNEMDPTTMDLEDIPKHAEVAVGDTVETSGYSFMFPPGMAIGAVSSAALPEGNNFYNIKVDLFNDLSRIEYVYIVKNRDRAELLQLKGNDE